MVQWYRLVGLIALILIFHPPVYAANLLLNADFESGAVDPWKTSGGGSVATISAQPVHSGAYALRVTNDSASSYGFQQAIANLEGGMFYEISGFGTSDDVNADAYFLRVAWYSSADASGTQLSQPNDTNKAANADGQWAQFDQIVQAPASAKSAKIRAVLTSKTAGVPASAYFDDIAFQESEAPTPTPTDSPTPTPIPRPTPTATPAPRHTPTPTATGMPTPTPYVNPTASTEGAVLGETNEPLPPPAATAPADFRVAGAALGLVGVGAGILSFVFVFTKPHV